MKNFKKLKIWQKGMEIVEETYKITRQLPKTEVYALASQMNRCSVSIPSNIAEGASRRFERDQARFIQFSMGSSFELETQLILSSRLYPEIYVEGLLVLLEEEQKMLAGYFSKLG
jgi:four helix bundle protein